MYLGYLGIARNFGKIWGEIWISRFYYLEKIGEFAECVVVGWGVLLKRGFIGRNRYVSAHSLGDPLPIGL